MTGPVVVKIGGGDLAVEDICADVSWLVARGHPVVIVHGGAGQTDRLAARLGVRQRRLTTPAGSSSRYTDPATLEVLTLALAGQVKPRLLAALRQSGVRAAGLTGIDGCLLTAFRESAHRAVIEGRTMLVRDDHSGRITHTDPAIVRLLLAGGVVPVISPPALDQHGQLVNVDADRAAAAVAAAVCASRLLFLTAAAGVLADAADQTSVIAELRVPAGGPLRFGPAGGGMATKLLAARDALRAGVPVSISDGRGAVALRQAIEGHGTAVRLGGIGEPVSAVQPGDDRQSGPREKRFLDPASHPTRFHDHGRGLDQGTSWV